MCCGASYDCPTRVKLKSALLRSTADEHKDDVEQRTHSPGSTLSQIAERFLPARFNVHSPVFTFSYSPFNDHTSFHHHLFTRLPIHIAVLIKMQIKDRVFYVTGGASGLGAATAVHLHSLGAYVAIMDLQLEASQSLASSLNSSPGPDRAAAFEVDVCSEEAVSAAIAGSDKLWPNVVVGGCVNCGGVGMAGKTINQDGEPFDLDTFRKTVEINLIGTFNVSRLTAARLVRDLPKPVPAPTETTPDLGVIINTASAAALEGQAGQCPYSASKGGVLSLTLPMARDLARWGIRVMTLVPTLFETPMMSQLPDRARKAILRTCEFPARFGKPEEFALAVQGVVENPMLVSSKLQIREKGEERDADIRD